MFSYVSLYVYIITYIICIYISLYLIYNIIINVYIFYVNYKFWLDNANTSPIDHSWGKGRKDCGNALEIELFQLALGVTLHVARLDRISLVMELFAATEGDLDLHQVSAQIDRGGNQRETLLIDFPAQLPDLAFMHKKPSGPIGFVVVDVSMGIGLDRQADEFQVVLLDRSVAVAEAEPTGSDRLNFRPGKGDAALEVFHHLVVEVRLPVLLQHLDVVLGVLHHSNHPILNPI